MTAHANTRLARLWRAHAEVEATEATLSMAESMVFAAQGDMRNFASSLASATKALFWFTVYDLLAEKYEARL